MGTTRVKLVDLSSEDQKEKKVKKPKVDKEQKAPETVDGQKIAVSETESPKQEKPKEVKSTAGKKAAKIKTRSKKYQEAVKLIDKTQSYSAKDALELLRKTSNTKFDPTVELHLNVSDKNVKGKVNFPHAVVSKVKEKKYLVFSDKKIESKNAIMANDKTVGEIESGKLKPARDFDGVITSAKYMPQLAKLAKILGPRGMMPNPKNGTITENPEKIMEGEDTGAFEFRTEGTAPIVHTKIGKLSFKNDQLSDNLKTLILAIGSTKIRKAVIKSTMSPAIKIDVTTLGK